MVDTLQDAIGRAVERIESALSDLHPADQHRVIEALLGRERFAALLNMATMSTRKKSG